LNRSLNAATAQIIPGLNLGIVGGDGVEPMRAGGKRVIRIPPELAFGSEGHSCYLGLKDQCTVLPPCLQRLEREPTSALLHHDPLYSFL
jgi:hypothetical protein